MNISLVINNTKLEDFSSFINIVSKFNNRSDNKD